MYDTIIIGGGLSGLVNAVQLSAAGLDVLLIEKNEYPFHRVCGEYVSNEVKPFLSSIGLEVENFQPAQIQHLSVTSPSGTRLDATLDMGAFGISRYLFDHSLYKLALAKGCRARLNTQALDIHFDNDHFTVKLSDGTEEKANIVLGTFGKRANLDRQLQRDFFYKRSPYIGVKYHIRTDFPKDRIVLHNFKDGYAGLSAIEDGRYCFCYLTTRENLKAHGSIPEMEKNILCKNPHLHELFQHSEFLFEKPEVINEISFEKKNTIENHIFFSGDTAGMIAPLCGNGMSMAIHGAKILSETILKYYRPSSFDRAKAEDEYTRQWNAVFARRLWVGKKIQDMFGQEWMTEAVVRTLKTLPPVTRWLIQQTHGKVV